MYFRFDTFYIHYTHVSMQFIPVFSCKRVGAGLLLLTLCVIRHAGPTGGRAQDLDDHWIPGQDRGRKSIFYFPAALYIQINSKYLISVLKRKKKCPGNIIGQVGRKEARQGRRGVVRTKGEVNEKTVRSWAKVFGIFDRRWR